MRSNNFESDEQDDDQHILSRATTSPPAKSISATYNSIQQELMDIMWQLWIDDAQKRGASRESIHVIHAHWLNGHISLLIK